LEAEQEPLADDDGVIGPTAVVLFNDPDPVVRAAAVGVLDACDGLLRACVARDERQRAGTA
jgi:hypothetical protein